MEKVGVGILTNTFTTTLNDRFYDDSDILVQVNYDPFSPEPSQVLPVQTSQGLLCKAFVGEPDEVKEVIYNTQISKFFVPDITIYLDAWGKNRTNLQGGVDTFRTNACAVFNLIYTDPQMYPSNFFRDVKTHIANPLSNAVNPYLAAKRYNAINDPNNHDGIFATSLDYEGFELIGAPEVLFTHVLNTCPNSDIQTGRYAPAELELVGGDYVQDFASCYTGKLYLSNNPAERILGIYKGFIDVELKVTGHENVIITEGLGSQCSFEYRNLLSKTYTVRLHFKTQCFYYVKKTSNIVYSKLNNDAKLINYNYLKGDIPFYRDFNDYNAALDSDGYYQIIYFSLLNSGNEFTDNEFIEHSNEFFIKEIYDNNGNLVLEEHYSTFALETGDYISYRPTSSQSRFNELLNIADSKSWNYGVFKSSDKFIIPEFNLTLSAFYSEKIFEINSDRNTFAIDKYFSFINGLYCAILDPVNKLIYYILRDGKRYFVIDLADFNDRIDYFGFNELNQFIIGSKQFNNLNIKYSFIDFKLVLTNFDLPKFVYEYKKIKFSFIPCQTRFLGKGGIITKV